MHRAVKTKVYLQLKRQKYTHTYTPAHKMHLLSYIWCLGANAMTLMMHQIQDSGKVDNIRNSPGDEITERERALKCGMGALYPYNHERGMSLSAVVGTVYINLRPQCELPCSNDCEDKQEVLSSYS